MSEVQLLKNKLAPLLNWHGARIDFLAKFLIAITKVSTVNLTHIAAAFSGKAEVDSKYKRICRFIKDFHIDLDLIANIIAKLFLPAVYQFCRHEKKLFDHRVKNFFFVGSQNFSSLHWACDPIDFCFRWFKEH